jgi:hypothetical protein
MLDISEGEWTVPSHVEWSCKNNYACQYCGKWDGFFLGSVCVCVCVGGGGVEGDILIFIIFLWGRIFRLQQENSK